VGNEKSKKKKESRRREREKTLEKTGNEKRESGVCLLRLVESEGCWIQESRVL